MSQLYEKNKLNFSLVWIGCYVVLASMGDSLSESIGITKVITVPILLILSGILYRWVAGNGLKEAFGLCPFRGRWADYLWFAPLGILLTVNLWHGVRMNQPPLDTALYIASMLLVGFLEELIFRGLLFKALLESGVKTAFVISSLTFGIGHIVNLLNGADLLPTLLQILYAITTGFLFTLIFYQSKCLLPCIVTHSIFNALSAFSVTPDNTGRILTALGICTITVSYALWLIRHQKTRCP